MREKLPVYGYIYADELAEKLEQALNDLRDLPEDTIIKGASSTYGMNSQMLCQIDPYVGFVNLWSLDTMEYEDYFGSEDEE